MADRIRRFYDIGRRSLAEHPEQRGILAEEARRFGLNPDTMGKARRFADPVGG